MVMRPSRSGLSRSSSNLQEIRLWFLSSVFFWTIRRRRASALHMRYGYSLPLLCWSICCERISVFGGLIFPLCLSLGTLRRIDRCHGTSLPHKARSIWMKSFHQVDERFLFAAYEVTRLEIDWSNACFFVSIFYSFCSSFVDYSADIRWMFCRPDLVFICKWFLCRFCVDVDRLWYMIFMIAHHGCERRLLQRDSEYSMWAFGVCTFCR